MQDDPRYFSVDGHYWWNGQTWAPLSPDRQYWWDGANWQPRSQFAPAHARMQRPEGLHIKHAVFSVVAGAQGVFSLVLGLTGPNIGFLVFGLVILVCFALAAWYSRGWTRLYYLSIGQAVIVFSIYLLGSLNFCLVGALFAIRDAIGWHERSIRA